MRSGSVSAGPSPSDIPCHPQQLPQAYTVLDPLNQQQGTRQGGPAVDLERPFVAESCPPTVQSPQGSPTVLDPLNQQKSTCLGGPALDLERLFVAGSCPSTDQSPRGCPTVLDPLNQQQGTCLGGPAVDLERPFLAESCPPTDQSPRGCPTSHIRCAFGLLLCRAQGWCRV